MGLVRGLRKLKNFKKFKYSKKWFKALIFWPKLFKFLFVSLGTEKGGTSRDRNVVVCSQKRALCVTATVLGALLAIALLIAYAGPQDCPCAGKMPRGYHADGSNGSEKFEPYATNGQLFPWLLPFLPSNIKPNRYTILIHPNLTTLEVKGKIISMQIAID